MADKRMILLIVALLVAPAVLGANNPGHDSLYVLKLGDSNVTGNINLTGNLNATLVRFTNRAFGDYLDINANGTVLGAPSQPRIMAGTNALYIDSTGNLYLNTKGGTSGIIQLGDTATNGVVLNVSGTIRQQNVNVCLQNGTGCPVIGGASSAGGWTNDSTSTRTQLKTIINSSEPSTVFEVYASGASIMRIDGPSGETSMNALSVGDVTDSYFFVQPGELIFTPIGFSISGSGASFFDIGSGYGDVTGGAAAVDINPGSVDASSALLSVREGGTEYLRVTGDGRVGVNTTNPTQALSIVGNVNVSGASAKVYTPELCLNGNCQTSWPSGADGTGGWTNTSTTTSTALIMNVNNNAVLFNGTTGSTPASGAGTRMMWIPAKSALRAGVVSGTQWDDAQIGTQSIALGLNTIANQTAAVAIGQNAEASGQMAIAIGTARATTTQSMALGQQAIASNNFAIAIGGGYNFLPYMGEVARSSGYASVAIGENPTASGNRSLALGSNPRAEGVSAIAIGTNVAASALNSVVIGVGNSSLLNNTVTNSFMVGFNRSAPTLFVNGSSVGINTITPGNALEVVGTINATAIKVGTTNICLSDGTNCPALGGGSSGAGWSNTSTTTSTALIMNVNNNAVLFNGTTGSTPMTGAGTRFMWIPDRGALRAGSVNSTQWDSVGNNSAALGLNNRVTGDSSFAAGQNNNISNNYNVALGQDNTLSHWYGVALGSGNTIGVVNSVAIGTSNAISSNGYGTAVGYANSVTGQWGHTFGMWGTASGKNAVVAGIYSTAAGENSSTFGSFLTANANGSVVIGTGSSSSNRLTNTIPNSVMIGAGSTVPTIFLNSTAVGIGTTAPNSTLHVIGDANITGQLYQNTAAVCLQNGTNCPAMGGGSNAGGWTNTSTTTSTTLRTIINSSDAAGSLLVQNTSGSTHLFVNGTSGRVGVGTNAPAAALSFPAATGQDAGIGFGTDVKLYRENTNSLAIYSSGTSIMNVMAAPGGYSSVIRLAPSNGGYGLMDFGGGGLIFRADNTHNVVFINNSQKPAMGIGTITPNATLEIGGNFSNGDEYFTLNDNGTDRLSIKKYANNFVEISSPNNIYFNAGGAVFKSTGSSTFQLEGGSTSTHYFQTWNGNLDFRTTGVNGEGFISFSPKSTEAMRIVNGSKIGINTTAPNSTLHVIGDANITGLIYQNTARVCLENGTGCPGTSYQSTAGGWTNTSTTTSTALNVSLTGNLTIGTGMANQSLLFIRATPGIGSEVFNFGNPQMWNQFVIRDRSYTSMMYGARTGGLNIGQSGADSTISWTNQVNNQLNIANNVTLQSYYDLVLGAGASERMRILSSGNVGINNTAPTSTLTVTGNISASGNIYAAGSQVCTAANGLCVTGTSSAGGWTNTSTQTTTTLDVGIGSTGTPNQKLMVTGNANITGTLYASNVSSNSPLQLQTAGTTRVYINDTGFVGIGTSNPAERLHINYSGARSRLLIENTDAAQQTGIQLKTGTTNADWIMYVPGSSTDLRFYRGSDVITFTSAGAVTAASFSGAGTGLTGTAASLSIGGNAGTASALAANPNNCGGGQAPAGIDASGNAEGCFTPGGITGGATGNLTKWTGATTVGNSMLYESGANIGLGRVNPAFPLDIQYTNSAGGVSETGLRVTNTVTFNSAQIILNSSRAWGLTAYGTGGAPANGFAIVDYGTSAVRLAIDTSGNVGINTTSPAVKLDISGNNIAYGGQLRIMGPDYAQMSFYNSGTPTLGSAGREAAIWYDMANSDFVVENWNNGAYGDTILNPSGGNVGVGLLAPTAKLDIAGAADTVGQISLQLRSGGTSNNFNSNQIAFGYANTDQYRHAIKSRHNAGAQAGNSIDFYTWNYGTDAVGAIGTKHVMTIDGNGNVGVGTTAPGLQAAAGRVYLTINGSSGPGVLEFSTTQADADGALVGLIQAVDTKSVAADKRIGGMSVFTDGTTANNRGGSVRFYTKADASSGFLERARIDRDGDLGIGTTDPTAKLHVSAGDASLALFGPNAQWGGKLLVGASPNQGIAATAQVISTDGNLHIDPAPNKNIYVGHYQARDMYINHNGGNVGIGTSAPITKLHVGGSDLFVSASHDAITGSTSYANTAATGSGVFVSYDGTNHKGRITSVQMGTSFQPLYFQGNEFRWATGVGTITEKMVLDVNGKVGIGTTAPEGKLDVRGGRVCISSDGSLSGCNGNNLQAGSLNIGNYNLNYGGGSNWNSNTAGLLMEAADNTEIAVHDYGARLASLMYYEGANNRIYIGRNMGWGAISAVYIGDGTGKLNAGTIDPVYLINNKSYATYMAGMTGVKEETTGKVPCVVEGETCRVEIRFAQEPEGSDLWLFAKTTSLKTHISNMTVLLTPTFDGRVWYRLDAQNQSLIIYGRPTIAEEGLEISYRLAAPRFDAANWTNYNTDENVTGFIIND